MRPIVLAWFNNKGGVGKTSLVYHLAWMSADLGVNVMAADLDPQANLTAAFLDKDRLEEIRPDGEHDQTVFGAIAPLIRGIGDITVPHVDVIAPGLNLLPGFEDDLSDQWPQCLDGKERAFRVISAFWRLVEQAAEATSSRLVLLDVGPNLGAINRAALISADFVVVPLSPDLLSLQGLRNLGPTLTQWRSEWGARVKSNPAPERLRLPAGTMRPLGYVVLRHAVRLDRPVQAYERWMARIPVVYREAVLGEHEAPAVSIQEDPHCLAMVKHYRSLMSMAQEARKPMFALRPADGAIGSHGDAVRTAYRDFRGLAIEIAGRAGLSVQTPVP